MVNKESKERPRLQRLDRFVEQAKPVVSTLIICSYGIGTYLLGMKIGADNQKESMQTAVAELRLSERKTSTLSLEQRQDYFFRQVVPTYGLVKGSHEYNVLERACTTGIYGSDKNDFNVPFDRVETAYAACGWNIKE